MDGTSSPVRREVAGRPGTSLGGGFPPPFASWL